MRSFAACGSMMLAVAAGSARAQCYFEQVNATPAQGLSSFRAMYDPVHSRILVVDNAFLLQTAPTRVFAWNGASWTLQTSGGPPARSSLGVAYDAARDKLVVYGGWASQTLPTFPGEVWEWNGASWSTILPTEVGIGRYRHGMIYDPARQRVVMFGGIYYGTLANDTLAWDGAEWNEYPVVNPPPVRRDPSLAFDSDRGRIMLFSGYAANNLPIGDLWEWDGASWTQRTVVPSVRAGQVTYDPVRHKLLLTGGSDGSQPLSEVWEFDGQTGVWSLVADFGPTLSTGSGVYVPTMGRVAFASGSGLRLWNADGSVVPPWITGQPSGGTYAPGTGAALSVGTGGSAPTFYQWQRNFIPLTNGGNVSGADGPILTLISLSPADAGSYRVVVSNACGTATSQGASITVVSGGCSGANCYANCDGSTVCPLLTANDFQCYINAFAVGMSYANCDGSISIPLLTANDFQCFLNAFAAGCT